MRNPEHEDRRVRKTKKQLSDALARLLNTKSLKSITVREIADEADINRGTFYLHYRDVADMAEQIQKEFTERFEVFVERDIPEEGDINLRFLLTEIFTLLAEYADLTEVLLRKNGGAAFPERLKASVRSRCILNKRYMARFKSTSDFEYCFSFIASGIIGITCVWLSDGRKETPEELACLAEKMVRGGAGKTGAKS